MLALKQEDFKLYGEKDEVKIESEYVNNAEKWPEKTITFYIHLPAKKASCSFNATRQQIKDLAEILTELSKLI